MKILISEAHILSLFPASFLMFYAEIWRRCCLIINLKKNVGEFLFFASFKTCMTVLVKRMHVLSTFKVELGVKNKPDK